MDDKHYKLFTVEEINKELLLSYFFKVNKKVNVVSLQSFIYANNSAKPDISKMLLSLENDGLIKPADSHCYKLTLKAYWQRIYSYRGWMFWTLVISFLILVLTVILILLP